MPQLMYCLSEKQLPPPFHEEMDLYHQDNARGQLTALMHKTCIIRHTFAQLEIQQQPSLMDFTDPFAEEPIDADQLLQDAMELDSRLEEWYQRTIQNPSTGHSIRTFPVNPEKRPHWARELFNLPGAPKNMQMYKSVLSAVSADLYRSIRLLLNLSILECVRRNVAESPVVDEKIATYNKSIAASTASLMIELINGLCMSVPCMLQLTVAGGANDPQTTEELYGFRGLLMLWPFHTAAACLQDPDVSKCDTEFMRAWVPCLFAFLNNSMSLAKAQAFMDKYC